MPTYQWRRFWSEPAESIHLDELACLLDSASPVGHSLNLHVVSLDAIAHLPCLVLLGEQGSGKTSALESYRAGLQPPPPHTQVRLVNLKDYGSEDRLYREVFEAPWWIAWRDGESTLVLIVDSLDEGLLRVSHLARVLARGLAAGPVDRLNLRIACRTADWPGSLEEQLRTLFGPERMGIYELAPLRQADIRVAAASEGIDASQFICELVDRGAGPLAARPMTLGLLIRAFKQHGGALARSQTDLYEQGCLALCEEPDRARREIGRQHPGLAGVLTPRQRLAVASRIAAAMLIGNRSVIVWDDPADVLDSDVALDDLAGGQEADGDERFVVNERALRETLRTGLFTARGTGRLGWAHQTYAEALAARYLREADFPQVRSLLLAADDQSGHLVPQLRDLAAWLAATRMDVFDRIIANEPEALLRGDVARVDDAYKERLVAALLSRFIDGDLLDRLELRSTYRKLCHPSLSQQLAAVIANRTLNIIARRAAIDIAEDCSRTQLLPELLALALDATENHAVRVQAAHAIFRIGDAATQRQLEPLARGAAGDDPDDDLRGVALRCLWPRFLSAEQLVSCLTQPKRDNYFGQYEVFLVDGLLVGAADADVPHLLSAAKNWTAAQLERLNPFGTIVNRLIHRAWDALEVPGVAHALAELITTYARQHDDIRLSGEHDDSLRTQIGENHEKRRAFLIVILNETGIRPDECFALVFSWMPLLKNDDAAWVLASIEQAPLDRQPVWARCLGILARGTESAPLIDGILVTSGRLPALEAEFAWLLEVWDLDSDRARQARETHRRAHELRTQTERQRVPLDPSPRERIRLDLDRCERGDAEGWISLIHDLTLEPTSTRHKWDYTTNPQETPGWKGADQDLRDRIRAAARSYIIRHVPAQNEWLGTDKIPYLVLGGYQAWWLLLEDREFRDAVAPDMWESWVPTLIGYPGQGHPWHEVISRLAYSAAPDAALRSLAVRINSEDRKHGNVFCLRDFGACWDGRLGSYIFDRVRARPLAAGSFFTLADLLLSHGHAGVLEYLSELIAPHSSIPGARELGPPAFALLLDHAADRHWPALSALLADEPDLAQQGLAWLVGTRVQGPFFKAINEDNLAELYVWLSRRFPPATDPDIEGFHDVDEREKMAGFRDTALITLVSRGTPAACHAIQRLIPELPDQQPGLTWQLREAEVNARRSSWRPPSVPTVIRLLQDRHRRYVESPDELVAVLVESLRRLQERLTGGELPSVTEVWSYAGGGNRRSNWRPKDEEDLSDYIARWLRDDLGPGRGIVVNREVQPRRGQETDIHVAAVNPAGYGDAITVILEVKGCWNDHLWTSMRSQLVDRYLRQNGLRHGLYVAGWYLCSGWTNVDPRKRRTRALAPDAVFTQLNAQSEEMKTLGFSVSPVVLDLALPTR